MNQNEDCDQRCSEICEKIFRAIRRIARGGEAPNSAQSEADPSVKVPGIKSTAEGGRRITLVLENGEGKSSTSNFPDNQVAIVAARTEPVKNPGHPGPGQSATRAAVTKPGLPVQGLGLEKTHPGSNAVGSVHEITITHKGANKPTLESTLSVDQESKRSGHDMDHRFTDYINRTWLKIRSMSNLGGGKDHSPTTDTRHDQFEEYISQGQKKLGSTASIGGGGGGRGFSSK